MIPDESYTALSDDDQRLRAIAALQQKARALDTEVADHQRLEQELQSRAQERTLEFEQAQDRLRGLSRKLLRMQDEEQRRVAFELHDSTAQLLAALAINVGLLEKHKNALGPRHADLISENSALVQQLLTEVRALSYTLHPPTLDVIGVASALQWYVDQDKYSIPCIDPARCREQHADTLTRNQRSLWCRVARIHLVEQNSCICTKAVGTISLRIARSSDLPEADYSLTRLAGGCAPAVVHPWNWFKDTGTESRWLH